MNETAFRELIVLASAGLGVAGFGLFQLVAGASRRLLVAANWAVGTAGAGLGSALVLDPTAGWVAAGLTAAITGGALVLGSPLFASILRGSQRPGVQAVGLAAVGLALLVGGVLRSDYQDAIDMDASLDWLVHVSERPPTHEVSDVVVTTDRASRIYPRVVTQPRSDAELQVLAKDVTKHVPQVGTGMPRGPASDACNCHGWVFTGGRYWLSPTDVAAILAENGYLPVTDPQAGDLVIYRLGTEIAHTAVVRATGPDLPVLVEGKWGWMGVYLHPVDQSCYGRNVTYYRSPREGHLLVGLGGKSPADAGTVRLIDEGEVDGH
jgi:hypothetical protein